MQTGIAVLISNQEDFKPKLIKRDKVRKFFKKSKTRPTIDPSIPFLDIYLRECKSGYNIDTCPLMLVSSIFTIVMVWSQFRCPITDEWIKKMWYIYTMEYYLDIKRKKLCHLQKARHKHKVKQMAPTTDW
jgi:hypothetical protein